MISDGERIGWERGLVVKQYKYEAKAAV